MLTRDRRELNEKISIAKGMNKKQSLRKLNDIFIHGTTSLAELKVVIDRIKNS
jgi:hypothetical protein